MFDFLKEIFGSHTNTKKNKTDLTDLIEENYELIEINGETFIKPMLSVSPTDAENILDLQKEMYKDELNQLPPLKMGEVEFNGVYLFETDDKLEASFFIRNGLALPISLENLPLKIIDSHNKVIAKDVFEVKNLGGIPSYSARPWKVYFSQFENYNKSDWKIEFDHDYIEPIKVEFDSLPESTTKDQQRDLEKYLEFLKPINPGEVNFAPFKIAIDEKANIHAIALVRNGTSQAIKFEKLPLALYDAEKRLVAEGLFEFTDFIVDTKKAVFRKFIFTPESFKTKEIYLVSWSINIAQPK